MDILFNLLAATMVGFAGYLGLLLAVSRISKPEQQASRLARRLGLEVNGPNTCAGEVDGMAVEATFGGQTDTTQLALPALESQRGAASRVLGRAYLKVGQAPSWPEGALVRPVEHGGTQTGDVAFDKKFSCEGGLKLQWFLDAEVRAALMSGEFWVDEEGMLRVQSITPFMSKSVVRRAVIVARLLAARHLSPEPGDVAQLESLLSDPQTSVSESAGALLSLHAQAPESSVRWVQIALGSPHLALRRAVLSFAAETEGLGDLKPTLSRLMDVTDPEEAALLLTLLERDANASCEAALVGLLWMNDDGVQKRAADILSEVGTLRAVAPLVALSEKGWPEHESVMGAARAAAVRIKDREGSIPAGGGLMLAEAEPTAGQLSVAGAETGLLSEASE